MIKYKPPVNKFPIIRVDARDYNVMTPYEYGIGPELSYRILTTFYHHSKLNQFQVPISDIRDRFVKDWKQTLRYGGSKL